MCDKFGHCWFRSYWCIKFWVDLRISGFPELERLPQNIFLRLSNIFSAQLMCSGWSWYGEFRSCLRISVLCIVVVMSLTPFKVFTEHPMQRFTCGWLLLFNFSMVSDWDVLLICIFSGLRPRLLGSVFSFCSAIIVITVVHFNLWLRGILSEVGGTVVDIQQILVALLVSSCASESDHWVYYPMGLVIQFT